MWRELFPVWIVMVWYEGPYKTRQDAYAKESIYEWFRINNLLYGPHSLTVPCVCLLSMAFFFFFYSCFVFTGVHDHDILTHLHPIALQSLDQSLYHRPASHSAYLQGPVSRSKFRVQTWPQSWVTQNLQTQSFWFQKSWKWFNQL